MISNHTGFWNHCLSLRNCLLAPEYRAPYIGSASLVCEILLLDLQTCAHDKYTPYICAPLVVVRERPNLSKPRSALFGRNGECDSLRGKRAIGFCMMTWLKDRDSQRSRFWKHELSPPFEDEQHGSLDRQSLPPRETDASKHD